MAKETTTFLWGKASSPPFDFPMIAALSASVVSLDSPTYKVDRRPVKLLHQANPTIDDATAGTERIVKIGIHFNASTTGIAARQLDDLVDRIGTTKNHLWWIDDSTGVWAKADDPHVPTDVTIEYVNQRATHDFLTPYGNGTLVYYTGFGGTDEIVVISNHQPLATPLPTFDVSAGLAQTHGDGAPLYAIQIMWPNAAFRGVSAGRIHNGKGPATLEFVVQDAPLTTGSLPA